MNNHITEYAMWYGDAQSHHTRIKLISAF